MNELKAKIVAKDKEIVALNKDVVALKKLLALHGIKYSGNGSAPSKSSNSGRNSKKQPTSLPEGWYYDDNGRLRDDRGHYAKL
jgi:hypothetical protein